MTKQVQQILGTVKAFDSENRSVDYLMLEWHETTKRIFRKKTNGGIEIAAKFLGTEHRLQKDDVLFADEQRLVVVDILPCDCLVIRFADALQLANICYEIGNKHLPLFMQDGMLLTPADKPVMRLLKAQGYEVEEAKRQLLHPLKTTVAPHASESSSLFSKIMKLTAADE